MTVIARRETAADCTDPYYRITPPRGLYIRFYIYNAFIHSGNRLFPCRVKAVMHRFSRLSDKAYAPIHPQHLV